MDSVDCDDKLKEFSKNIHLVVLPSTLWAVHVDPQYQFIAIIYIQLKSFLKPYIKKGVLLTLDKINNVMSASFFLHEEMVYLPELNSTIKSVVDLSHVLYILHSLTICVNIDNSRNSECNKYIEFGKNEIFCQSCLSKNETENAILWKELNSYGNSLLNDATNNHGVIEDTVCSETSSDKAIEMQWGKEYIKPNSIKSDDEKTKPNCNHRSFCCDQCSKSFLTKSCYQEHLKACKKDKDVDLGKEKGILTHVISKCNLCNICGKTFCQGYRIEDHLLTHSSERPFECNICHKTFAKSYNLKLHQNTHLGVRPFVCSICGKTYTTQSNLATHVRSIHTKKKPHACTNCNMSFVHPRHLRLHMRKHTGEKPYDCLICGKSFAKNIHLTIHLRTHTGEKPHVCTVCGKGFTTSGNLNSHKLVHHKDIK